MCFWVVAVYLEHDSEHELKHMFMMHGYHELTQLEGEDNGFLLFFPWNRRQPPDVFFSKLDQNLKYLLFNKFIRR